MKNKTPKPKKECTHKFKAIEVGNPMIYQCTKCGIKLKSPKTKKTRFSFTLDKVNVDNAQNLIKNFKKIKTNEDSKLNLSKIINRDLELLNLQKLMDYGK